MLLSINKPDLKTTHLLLPSKYKLNMVIFEIDTNLKLLTYYVQYEWISVVR